MAGIPLNTSDLYSSSGSTTVGSRIPIGQAVLKQKLVTTDAISYPILFDDVPPSSPAGTFSGIGCMSNGSVVIKTPGGSFIVDGTTSGLTFTSPFVLTVGAKTYTFDTSGDCTIATVGRQVLQAGSRTYTFDQSVSKLTTSSQFTLVSGSALYTFGSNPAAAGITTSGGSLELNAAGTAYILDNISPKITTASTIEFAAGANEYALLSGAIPRLSYNGTPWLGGISGVADVAIGIVTNQTPNLSAVSLNVIQWTRVGLVVNVIANGTIQTAGAPANASFDLTFNAQNAMLVNNFTTNDVAGHGTADDGTTGPVSFIVQYVNGNTTVTINSSSYVLPVGVFNFSCYYTFLADPTV